ncbi:hypothetical protein H9Q09_04945 [Aurantimonas sp. DM33-3]|uniref:hypothetical protein n=1 Tax=Aurantimonas sp. DM33-3 TaxID=2766955 RepID=UPI0016526CDB|nr:hypothetical protein [Aurantimonas sp. DM33-3]MBC6715539.1 hypothetical protein [Aurantimonas sp. DM33-3]
MSHDDQTRTSRLLARMSGWRLTDEWGALPWTRINWGLHMLWGFLIVLIWNSDGNPDTSGLSVSMTVLQTFLAVVAVGGFWLLRSEVRSAALKELEEIAPKLARDELYPMILREVMDGEGLIAGAQVGSDEDLNDLVTEFGRENGG